MQELYEEPSDWVGSRKGAQRDAKLPLHPTVSDRPFSQISPVTNEENLFLVCFYAVGEGLPARFGRLPRGNEVMMSSFRENQYCTVAEPESAATAAVGAGSAVDAEALRMILFAQGSPLAMTLDVFETYPELRARFLDAVEARLREMGPR